MSDEIEVLDALPEGVELKARPCRTRGPLQVAIDTMAVGQWIKAPDGMPKATFGSYARRARDHGVNAVQRSTTDGSQWITRLPDNDRQPAAPSTNGNGTAKLTDRVHAVLVECGSPMDVDGIIDDLGDATQPPAVKAALRTLATAGKVTSLTNGDFVAA
jgi:hypothetical protein